jgi:hypothetical protein
MVFGGAVLLGLAAVVERRSDDQGDAIGGLKSLVKGLQ